MSYTPKVGERCQYKEKGGVNWCLCVVLAFHDDLVWLDNLAVGSKPVKRIRSVEFKPVLDEAPCTTKAISDKQAEIVTNELIPMIVADITPFLGKVIEKRLHLFAAEIIKSQNGGAA